MKCSVGRSINDRTANFRGFFAVDTPSYRLDLRYLYHWNVQVLTKVTVRVPFVYVAWLSKYRCFPCFDGGLVHRNTVVPLSEMHDSRTTVSREPCNLHRQDLYRYVGENLHIPMIPIS